MVIIQQIAAKKTNLLAKLNQNKFPMPTRAPRVKVDDLSCSTADSSEDEASIKTEKLDISNIPEFHYTTIMPLNDKKSECINEALAIFEKVICEVDNATVESLNRFRQAATSILTALVENWNEFVRSNDRAQWVILLATMSEFSFVEQLDLVIVTRRFGCIACRLGICLVPPLLFSHGPTTCIPKLTSVVPSKGYQPEIAKIDFWCQVRNCSFMIGTQGRSMITSIFLAPGSTVRAF